MSPSSSTLSPRTSNALLALGIGLFITTFFFVAKQVSDFGLKNILHAVPNNIFYFLFAFLILAWLLVAWQQKSKFFLSRFFLTRSLLFFLPATLTLLAGISLSSQFHFLFQIGSGLALILTLSLLFFAAIEKQPRPLEKDCTPKEWFRSQGVAWLLAVVFFTALFFSFATYRLGQYAAVDEPLWLYGRTPKFWHNIYDQEWSKTDISDKPGITVALTSGIGLLRYDPNQFDDSRKGGEVFVKKDPAGMTSFFFTYRFPLVLLITILLPLLYFLLERLIGKRAALFSYAFLTISPILIGIAKIINPDALLWLFTTLSLLSYLVFQKRNWYRYLLLSGVFLGLALLTKYIANIIFIYLLALLFLEYLYHPVQKEKSLPQYIRQSFLQIGLVAFTALASFYLLLPANWPEPKELIRATLLSEAFVKVAPLFIGIVIFLLLDQITNKNRITAWLLNILTISREWIAKGIVLLFFGSVVFTFVTTLAGMKVYDFMELISSPKTIERNSDLAGIFLTNFYPLIFSLIPLALVGLLLASFFLWKKNFYENDSYRFAFYALIFTLVYYAGATVNGVGSIIRYQIIIFPLIALVAGIGVSGLVSMLQKQFPKKEKLFQPLLLLIIAVAGLFTLLRTPFPLSYASSLLPAQYFIDLKDMGPGSYEIAEQLNALPDAENTLIWTDKDGVCQFFVGRCKRGNGEASLTDKTIDYIVVSSTRENRTKGMIANQYDADNIDSIIPVQSYYNTTVPADFSVFINGRPSHFVKAYHYDSSQEEKE